MSTPNCSTGSQRLAWLATWIFGQLNGLDLRFTVDDAEEMVLAVARGDLDAPQLSEVLEAHGVPVSSSS